MGAIAPKEDAKGGRFLTPFAQWVQLLRNGCNCSEKCTPITRKKCPFGQLLGGFAPKNGGSQQVKYWVLLLRIMQSFRTDCPALLRRLSPPSPRKMNFKNGFVLAGRNKPIMMDAKGRRLSFTVRLLSFPVNMPIMISGRWASTWPKFLPT